MKIARLAFVVTISAAGSMACGSNLLGGDAGASEGNADAASSTTADAASGAGCTGDLGGGVVLCTYISLCPSIGVDHDQFPNCGFRVRGDALDLECVCNGMLCPMGAPASCSEAKKLLGSQSELLVCQQTGDGRCTTVGAGTGGADGGANPCNTECSGMCGGDPSCIQGCGC